MKKEKTNPKTVEEDLASLREEDFSDDKKRLSSRAKRIILICSGVFVLLLFLSLIYLQYPLFNVIQGQIESKSVNNNVLQLKDFNVIFSDAALQKIQTSFDKNQKVETSLCLLGEKNGNDYFISDAYTPVIYEQSFRSVTTEPCNSSTIIMFHTHPYKSCVASDTDLNTLKRNQLNNPDMLTIVMCETNRYSVYG